MSSPYSTGFFDPPLPDPEPRTFVVAKGRRKYFVSDRVMVDELENSAFHQERMADVAARAVRWFASQPVDVEWHTLSFSIYGVETDELDHEIAQLWRWEVWVS